jgi:hypothetical protein
MPLILPPDLAVAQTAIWLDQQLFPGRPIYNTGQALTIRGMLRADLFEVALRETLAESPGPGPVRYLSTCRCSISAISQTRLPRPSNGCETRCAWRFRWRILRYFASR